ncbi:MAG TPA: head GIN domain-containing protein [candidate division Zixibacteria bacterium]|nr:head GIN domain-containing protein [candidate division Zixibacteria bacterium]
MKTKLTLIALVCALALGSVPNAAAQWRREGERVRGSGNVTTEKRDVSDFNIIAIQNATDIEITIGPEFSAVIEAEDNLLEYITTDVRRKTLYVDDVDGYSISTRNGSTLKITMPSLAGLEINGSSNVTADGLKEELLVIEISGSGDIALSGEAREVEVEIDGSGDVDAREFSAAEAVIEINGSGDVRMKVSDHLDVNINGSGDVTYYGEPRVRKRIYGSGDLRQRRP